MYLFIYGQNPIKSKKLLRYKYQKLYNNKYHSLSNFILLLNANTEMKVVCIQCIATGGDSFLFFLR